MNTIVRLICPAILLAVFCPAVAHCADYAPSLSGNVSHFGAFDYALLLAYLATIIAIGAYFSLREKTSNDYFLAGGRVPWVVAGLSMMASQVSSIGFMAVPAKSYATDWAYYTGVITWFMVVPIVTRAYIPFFRRLNVTSAYEYLEERFHLSVRLCGTVIYSILQLGRLAIVLYLPALALSTVSGIDKSYCIILTGVVCTSYVMAGGIEAIVWLDALQAILLIGGALLCITIVLVDIGGVGRFWEVAHADGKFNLAEIDWSMATATLWVVLAGNFFARLGELTSDQTIVQRYMVACDERASRKSLWTNVGMAIPWATVAFLFGTTLYVFYQIHPELMDPSLEDDAVVPWFIAHSVPPGLSGLIIAAICAAALSSLDSAIHSVATIWVTDFVVRLRPKTSDAARLRLGRGFTLLLGAFGTAAALWIAQTEIQSLWDSFQTIVSLFVGGLSGLFALGIFTRRARTIGALVGLASSAVVLWAVIHFTAIHFFLYAGIGFLACFIIGYLTSLLWPGREKLNGMTIYDLKQMNNIVGKRLRG